MVEEQQRKSTVSISILKLFTKTCTLAYCDVNSSSTHTTPFEFLTTIQDSSIPYPAQRAFLGLTWLTIAVINFVIGANLSILLLIKFKLK